VLLALAVPSLSEAADLSVALGGAPPEGRLVFQVYDDPDSFGRFRDPAREIVLSAQGDGEYVVQDLESEEIAVLVYVDQNGNGVLDRNFIGIPRESIGLSNNCRPKGPPSFDRASFRIDGSSSIDIELFRVLGERGQIGVGLGAIGRSSPYLGSTESVYQLIPTIAYIGDRLQWLGPELNFGLAGSDRARLALAASYRIGSYEANDSPVLADLGDRESTLLLGLGLEFDLPRGLELEAAYRHDDLIASEEVSPSLHCPEAFKLESSDSHGSFRAVMDKQRHKQSRVRRSGGGFRTRQAGICSGSHDHTWPRAKQYRRADGRLASIP
jgi:outer membrane protein